MQIKTSVRYQTTPAEWLPSINQQITSVGEDVEKREPQCTVGRNADCCSHCGKYGVSFKLKIEFPFNPAIPLLGINPKDLNITIQKKNAPLCL